MHVRQTDKHTRYRVATNAVFSSPRSFLKLQKHKLHLLALLTLFPLPGGLMFSLQPPRTQICRVLLPSPTEAFFLPRLQSFLYNSSLWACLIWC